MRKKRPARRLAGQSLFEVIIALGISALVIVTLVALVSAAIRNATFSKNKTEASRYAQEAVEWLRTQRDKDIGEFKEKTVLINWCLVTLAWDKANKCSSDDYVGTTRFIREVEFDSSISSGKTAITANIKVYWEDSSGLHETMVSTNFSDWRER